MNPPNVNGVSLIYFYIFDNIFFKRVSDKSIQVRIVIHSIFKNVRNVNPSCRLEYKNKLGTCKWIICKSIAEKTYIFQITSSFTLVHRSKKLLLTFSRWIMRLSLINTRTRVYIDIIWVKAIHIYARNSISITHRIYINIYLTLELISGDCYFSY